MPPHRLTRQPESGAATGTGARRPGDDAEGQARIRS